MGELELDVAGVRALARRVLDEADALDGILWPAVGPDDLPGSSTGRATAATGMEDRIADVVARMRTWAAAAQSATAGVQRADGRQAGRLGQPR